MQHQRSLSIVKTWHTPPLAGDRIAPPQHRRGADASTWHSRLGFKSEAVGLILAAFDFWSISSPRVRRSGGSPPRFNFSVSPVTYLDRDHDLFLFYHWFESWLLILIRVFTLYPLVWIATINQESRSNVYVLPSRLVWIGTNHDPILYTLPHVRFCTLYLL